MTNERIEQLMKAAAALIEANKAGIGMYVIQAIPDEVLDVLTELKASRTPAEPPVAN